MAIFRPISWGRLTGLALAMTMLFGTPPANQPSQGAYRLGYFTGCFVIFGAATAITAKRKFA